MSGDESELSASSGGRFSAAAAAPGAGDVRFGGGRGGRGFLRLDKADLS
ncbi:MAG TPA: hypothetical protein PKD61_28675 [Polyangiaceae bacterium]|nr:hypothetical protein [Polyangiaceae bacterium]